jgi:hypothetical protein
LALVFGEIFLLAFAHFGVGFAHSFEVPIVLVNRAITHLGLGRVLYQNDVTPLSGSPVLVSGSPEFLARSALSLHGCQAIFLGSEHRTSSRSPPGPARLRLRHRSFGGPTHFVTLFGCQGLACVPEETALRRLVGHMTHGTLTAMQMGQC